jgi:hypothetical protein
MVSAFVAGLALPVSSDRLESYRPPNGTDLELLVNYLWNMELTEAIFPCLHAAEISFRNAIHTAASARYGTDFWFDRRDVLMAGQSKSIARACSRLTGNQKPHTAGRIVAELSFGFWVSLLNRPYERRVGTSPADRLYWHDRANRPALLLAAFPHLTNRYRTRRAVEGRFRQIVELRNRVAHHEPIWSRPDLKREHNLILGAIGWISPQMREAIALCDRFADIHEHGRARVEVKVRSYLGGDRAR